MKLIAQFPPTDPLVTLQEASEGVYVLQMHHGADNRFNRPFCQALLDALTHVEQLQIPAALITVGQTKFFSNGLALDQVLDDFGEFQTNYYGRVLLRWLTSPLVTIAALNGHAFAGGMIFAMANDYRIMRQDRGFLCMNEVDMPAPLSPGMCATIRMRFSNMQAFRDCILEAKRFNAKESLELGLVDDIVGEKDVLTRALALGEKLKAKSTPVYGQLKEEAYKEAVDALRHGGMGFTVHILSSKL
jgi:enoyl-CoA hydratase/carnithine racemase